MVVSLLCAFFPPLLDFLEEEEEEEEGSLRFPFPFFRVSICFSGRLMYFSKSKEYPFAMVKQGIESNSLGEWCW